MKKLISINIFARPYAWAVIYSAILTAATVFIILDTFVIPRAISVDAYTPATESQTNSETNTEVTTEANGETETETEVETKSSEPIITDTSYSDGNIQITIETVRLYDTAVYIADVQVTDVKYLKSAFAKGTYGRNIKQTTSKMAKGNDALLAINGDYYGFRDDGFVLRNGILFRKKASDGDALLVDSNGDFSIIDEGSSDVRNLCDQGAWQIWSFGPALIENSQLTVNSKSVVNVDSNKEMKSNPRTAIGQISALHYIFVVSDGRTEKSAGLSLLELAQVMSDRGCVTAYNLDGGGSSTMWFIGKIVNIPTDGNSFGERSVSDIIYIGYK
jgi:Exopolysaccharide biosynthesis protein related to N-acetylglucosamine-1-phosphodiester alpha-N-acetylglucosaminidase